MRLLVTIETAPRQQAGQNDDSGHDVVLDYAPETRVGDLASALSHSGQDVPANVVALPGAASVPTLTGPVELYLGDAVLDPALFIDQSPIRHGVVLGLGCPSSQRGPEPRGLVEVRISSGPGAGHVHRLGIGRATLGHGRHCTIRVPELADDPQLADVEEVLVLDVAADESVTITPDDAVIGQDMPVPLRREPVTAPIVLEASSISEERRRRFLRRRKVVKEFQLGDRIDPATAVPLVTLDRRVVAGATPWEPDQTLGVGPLLLDRVEISEPDASLSPSPSGPTLDYNRPPRLHPAAQPNEFSLPQEPRRPDKMPFPMAMMLMPVMMSGVTYFISHTWYSLLFALGMPMMMVANATGSRRQAKKRYDEQVDEYRKRRVNIETAAVTSLVGERGSRRHNFPDPATVLLFATGPRARLWERRPWDRDFLHLRIGTSDLPSDVTIKDPTRDTHEGPLLWTAPDVPVTIPVREAGVVGIAGAPEECRTVAMWAVAQVTALHSPSDAVVGVLLGSSPSRDWDWVKWLPHARNDEGHPRPVRIATDDDNRSAMISELMSELEARRELDEKQVAGMTRWIVVLDGARQIRMNTGMVSLLKDGPRVGLFFICLDRTVRELPEECRTVAAFENGQLNLETNEQRHVDAIRPDIVSGLWLERLARALAPIRDVSTEDLASALPAASRLLDVLGLHEPDAGKLVRRWQGGGRTTKAVIGESTDGLFQIDIRADGPHGLVAGTTGSGKSELLQTLIASLAIGNRPDEFNFVLVDYKGGAAFKDCNHLPHTVGMVTDLDGHLTTRALESLGAELRRREHQLADADAKDIEDYLAGRQPDEEPMPRLLIVIDEFAALASELPDFVTGLVDVARRGRSLGVHLILATQRPAGVVSAEIKSNTNLRIALRVTDAGDSDDVIESQAAAQIPKVFPGRAYARLGHSSLTPFQSSRVGGRPGGGAGASVRIADLDWGDLPLLGRIAGPADDHEDDVSIPTDLASLVAAINGANAELGLPEMRKPWLPQLPERLGVDELTQPQRTSVELVETKADSIQPIPFGLADLPRQQQQVVESWDLVNGSHLMIAGQSRSGRSNSLRVLAGGIARLCSPEDVHLYGIDAGNNALLPLMALPHVGAVVTRTQTDRMYRLVAFLQKELANRQQALAERGFADIGEQRSGVPADERLPYLVVLLDRWEGFVQAFESVDGGVLLERITAILQEGAGVGIRMVMTADRSGLVGRISTLIEDRIALSMSDPGDFSNIGIPAREVPVSMPPGRAFRAGERPREVQWGLLDVSGVGTDQVRVLQEIGREAGERYADLPRSRRPQRVDDLPAAISAREARDLEPASASRVFVPVGVGGDSLALQGFDPEIGGNGFMITGPPRSGKSTALHFMLSQPRRGAVTAFVPRRSPLLVDTPRGVTVFNGTEPIDQIVAHLDKARGDQVIAVEDFEVIGSDSPLGQLLAERFARMRDTGSTMIITGGIDDMLTVYRGLPNEMKRGRSGLVLAPRASNDGDVLNVRLPRSASGAMPVGRGVLASPLGWTWVQVPRL